MLDYQKKQAGFAAHLRQPLQNASPDGVEERRMKIYRDLFFNNIRGFITSGFPVLHSLFKEEEWDALIRDFYASHKAKSPYFLEISEEFLAWLQDDSLPIHQRYPFALELAHYEWVELGLDVAEEESQANINMNGDFLKQLPVLSSLAWPLVYAWPVHMISCDFQPEEPSSQPTCLVVYRNRNDKVEFLEANAVTLRLLGLLGENTISTGEQALRQLASEMPQSDVNAVIDHGLSTLQQLRDLDIIIGTC